MTAPEDLNVDDLKRRARRRLIGAIVLALATAVFVPMLLESEPRPLGEDVTVRIPPIDDGKFVSRLSEKAKPAPAKADSRPDTDRAPALNAESAKAAKAEAGMAKPEAPAEEAKSNAPASSAAPVPAPRRSLSDAEQKVLAAPAKAPSLAPAPQAAAPPPLPRPAATPAPNAAPEVSAKATPGSSESPAPGFSVQLGAFSDDKGANALSNKLKRAGYPAYVEPLATSKGTWWRVRVGPYPSRDAAATSRDKLKGDGYSGIVAAVK
ncbi:MAG: SPOR domain-containing protein [Burkholderiales bacterium]|nr:SPOR domain-containing protein [Burkholderiales bacterium]